MNKHLLGFGLLVVVILTAGCPPEAPKPPATPPVEPVPVVSAPSIWFTQVEKGGDAIVAHIDFSKVDPHQLQVGNIAADDAIAYIGYKNWAAEAVIVEGKTGFQGGTSNLNASFSKDGKWRGNFYLVSKLGKFAWIDLGTPKQPKFATWYGGNEKLVVDDGQGKAVIEFDKSSYTEITQSGEGEGEGECGLKLRVGVTPEGSGKVKNVTANSAAVVSIDQNYPAGTALSISAVPNSGYVFVGWSGDASGNINPLAITMDKSKNIKAVFVSTSDDGSEGEGEGEPLKSYRVLVNPHYYSEVTLSVDGQELEYSGSWAMRDYYIQEGATVDASVDVPDGYTFDRWICSYMEISKQEHSSQITFTMPNWEISLIVSLNTIAHTGEGEGEGEGELPDVRKLATEPVKVGSYKANEMSTVVDVAVVGTTAFVADQGFAEVQILDIADPANPWLIQTISVMNPKFVRFHHGCLYIVSGDIVMVYDMEVNDWAEGSYIADASGAGIYDLATFGDYLYIAGGNSLETVDISDKDNLVCVGRINVGCGSIDLDPTNSLLYLATDKGLNVYRMDFDNLVELSAVEFLGEDSVGQHVAVSNGYAAVGDNDGVVTLLDVIDPSNPVVVDSQTFESFITGLVWYQGYLYVGEMTSFSVVDGMQVGMPIVGEVVVGGMMLTSMSTTGHYLCTANSSSLKIYDLLEPEPEQ